MMDLQWQLSKGLCFIDALHLAAQKEDCDSLSETLTEALLLVFQRGMRGADPSSLNLHASDMMQQ
jgi:hypothetical protein